MGDNTGNLHDPEEAEESLSLCDLPLNTDETNYENRRSSSEPTEFFEFFCDLTTSGQMCQAEDIISDGKLVLFKHQSVLTATTPATKHHQIPPHSAFRKRSESLPEFKTATRSSSLMRNSRSLDSRKLDRSSSSEKEIERNFSGKSLGRADTTSSVPKVPKSPWYLMVFGSLKFPPEMELRDIKNRQVRRNPASLIPDAVNAGRRFPVNRSGGKSYSWGLLRALSCKDPASAAVAASFVCVPHV